MSTNTKSCLVTGCSEGGAGAALATAFQQKGYHVFATARSASKIPQSLHTASNVTIIELDVASSESIAVAAQIVKEKTGGKLDVLINNAGLGLEMPGLDTPIAEARKLFDVNFFGAMEMVQAFSHMLVDAKGCIVNNSSVGSRAALPFLSIYQATKAALSQASDVWRLELEPLGVRVLNLLTGGIKSEFVNNLPTLPYPEDSYYATIKDIVPSEMDQSSLYMKPDVFAQDIVRHVERGATGKLWVGGGAGMMRTALWLLPEPVLNQALSTMKPFAKKLAEDHKKRQQREGK